MYKSLSSVFSIALLVVSGAALGATPVYTNTFDSGWGDNTKLYGGCYDYSFALAKSPVQDGPQSARVVVKGWEDSMSCLGSAKHRAQIRYHDSSIINALGELHTPTWLGFSVFVPADFPVGQDHGIIALQLNGGSAPEFDIQIQKSGRNWQISQEHTTGVGKEKASDKLATPEISKGQWTDFVIYRERSWDADGVTKIWMNGKQIVDHVGPNAIDYTLLGASGEIRLSTGIYWATATSDAVYTLYYDSVRVAVGSDGYSMVAPSAQVGSAPPAPPTLLQ